MAEHIVKAEDLDRWLVDEDDGRWGFLLDDGGLTASFPSREEALAGLRHYLGTLGATVEGDSMATKYVKICDACGLSVTLDDGPMGPAALPPGWIRISQDGEQEELAHARACMGALGKVEKPSTRRAAVVPKAAP